MALRAGILLAALALGFAGCRADRGAPTPEWVVASAEGLRFTSGRLASQRLWRVCAPDDEAALVARARCDRIPRPGSRRYRRLARAAMEVRARLRSDPSSASRHALALVDLQWHEVSPAALEHAVATLEEARRASPSDPALLNDLGVAYLATGERDQQLLPVLRGLQAIEQALAVDSTHVPALFNRALILDRLYLVASARRAWTQYLARERDPAWRREAAVRLRADIEAVQPEPDTEPAALLALPHDGRTVAALVGRTPDRGRTLGFRVLEAWGTAVVSGDSMHAARLLALAGAVAAAQDSLSGDRSVAEALFLAANSSLGSARRRALATAHEQFGSGVRLFFQSSSAAALAPLDSAGRGFRALGAPTARWAEFFLAASHVNMGRYTEGDSIFRGVLDAVRPAEPALEAKTLLALGLSQLRRGNYEPAIELYRAAAPSVERAREPETAGHAAYLATEGFVVAGQTLEGQEEAYRGLRMLSRLRRSNYLNNHLSRVAGIARDAGLNRAALDLSNEVLEVARGLGKPDVFALALCARARDLSAAGRGAEAMADLRAAAVWADSMPREPLQNRIRAAVLLARGEIVRRSDPRGALPLLAAAVDSFRDFQTDRNLPEALFQAALAADSAGEPARARRWIREAVSATERQQSVFRHTAGRAAFAELVERVSDQMIAYELADGRADSAFAYLERARVAAWPPRVLARRRPLTPGQVRARLPADMLLVEYALLGDRVVVWSVSPDAWRAHVLAVSRDSVRGLVARLPNELSEAAPSSAPALTQLYDLLLRPLGPMLARARRVVIVPDRELHSVPFTALRNGDDGS
ncbi:MAG TPA: CHAT domain-containing protein, partial [Longimicrobium sp.]|nr:CHAT domain-containing protein [Longimicrobium sp.]